MTIHPNDQPRTAATPPDRGMGWGIPVIVVAGLLLAGLFGFKAMEDHTGTTTIPISRADRLAPSPAPTDATSPAPSPVLPGGTQ
jgi:hypothetical protein